MNSVIDILLNLLNEGITVGSIVEWGDEEHTYIGQIERFEMPFPPIVAAIKLAGAKEATTEVPVDALRKHKPPFESGDQVVLDPSSGIAGVVLSVDVNRNGDVVARVVWGDEVDDSADIVPMSELLDRFAHLNDEE